MNYNPLPLPSSGFQLVEGHQYVMDKYARNMVREEYGLVVPAVATCVYRRHYAERATHKVENLETHEVREWTEERPAVQATFFFLSTASKRVRFCLSCESLAEVRALNASAEKALEEIGVQVKKSPATQKKAKLDADIAALIAAL